MFLTQINIVTELINKHKSEYYKADCKETFHLVKGLFPSMQQEQLPPNNDPKKMVNNFAIFFVSKIKKICESFDTTDNSIDNYTIDCFNQNESCRFSFQQVTEQEVRKIITDSRSKSCSLDIIPTRLLQDETVLHTLLPWITCIIKSSLHTGQFPQVMKHAIVRPLLKKSNMSLCNLGNYRPISNINFLSKVLEKVVVRQIVGDMNSQGIHDPLQSAYKNGHGVETA